MFAVIFFSILAVAASLSVVGNRATSTDAVSAHLHQAGRRIGAAEMAQRALANAPLR